MRHTSFTEFIQRAWCLWCSEFREFGGRWGCTWTGCLRTWETKTSSTSTRCWVRRPAVEKLASPQQAPLKLHEETWAGLLKNRGLRISQEVEIVPGCAVRVTRPSRPDYSSEPPGPGRVIRNMLGWSRLVKQKGLGYGCSGVPSKERIFFSP